MKKRIIEKYEVKKKQKFLVNYMIITFLKLYHLKHYKLFLKNIKEVLYLLNKNYKKINLFGNMKKVNKILKLVKILLISETLIRNI